MTPTEQWHWKAARRASELEAVPPRLAPAEAQRWCNFTLWHPEELPAGCDTAAGTLRKEAPPGRTGATEGRTPWSEANPAAYRTEISGGGRRLRIKQFLYDWAFPAADHPSLWGSEVRHHPIGGGRVVWLGTDYQEHRAASARMSRTTVELSVLAGEFTDAELVSLFRALRPAVAGVPERVIGTPFSQLSYWARHSAGMVPVPTGLFVFQRMERAHEGDWVHPAGLGGFLAAQGVPAALGGFTADSAAVFAAEEARELEVIYTSADADGSELRLVLQRPGAGRMPYPPLREKHPATSETTEAGGLTVQLAYVDADVGPFDAQWRDAASAVDCKLVSSAREGMDRTSFLSYVGAVVAAKPLRGEGAAL